MRSIINSLAFAVAAVAALGAAGAASAANLVTNGGFNENNAGANSGAQVGYAGVTLTGWNVPAPNGSYVFVFNPKSGTSGTSADHVGSVSGEYGILNLWGPGESNGVSNGLENDPNGVGGAFIAADPSYQNGAITQMLNDLTAGAQYTVSFDYAGAEQYAHTGATNEGWQVGFGSATQSTALLSDPSEGFTGWSSESFTFTANGTSELLSFLAIGTSPPNSAGDPPFALLDNVDVTQWCPPGVPEPATWAMMLVGIGGLGGALRMRRQQQFAAA